MALQNSNQPPDVCIVGKIKKLLFCCAGRGCSNDSNGENQGKTVHFHSWPLNISASWLLAGCTDTGESRSHWDLCFSGKWSHNCKPLWNHGWKITEQSQQLFRFVLLMHFWPLFHLSFWICQWQNNNGLSIRNNTNKNNSINLEITAKSSLMKLTSECTKKWTFYVIFDI